MFSRTISQALTQSCAKERKTADIGVVRVRTYLAGERAETEGLVHETPVARQAQTGEADGHFGVLRRQRPPVQEHHTLPVVRVRLHQGHVRHRPQRRHPDHLVVRRPPYLQSQRRHGQC